jgi:hypothetical protein
MTGRLDDWTTRAYVVAKRRHLGKYGVFIRDLLLGFTYHGCNVDTCAGVRAGGFLVVGVCWWCCQKQIPARRPG